MDKTVDSSKTPEKRLQTTVDHDASKEMSYYIYPKKLVFPLHLRPLGNLWLDAPFDAFGTLKQTYETSNCNTYFYSHKFESVKKMPKISVNCKMLKDFYGFVYREKATNGSGIIETLVQGDKVLSSKFVPEPVYAITKPYELELK